MTEIITPPTLAALIGTPQSKAAVPPYGYVIEREEQEGYRPRQATLDMSLPEAERLTVGPAETRAGVQFPWEPTESLAVQAAEAAVSEEEPT